MNTALLGSIGLILLLISGIPQQIKLLKTKSSKDISVTMYIMTAIGLTLLLSHAIKINDKVFILTNALNLISVFFTITLILSYGGRK